eukprot:CAMPEP_0114501902 /NCGR_PEP_ID=MMETSP0109-20121206/8755_1 /TAXON_ID=29199 /ORGANISM="Chlorarachnion reptans, Strain CCCM449" /LENGTH=862 /DNA_ID=CAMNT_0001679681 /DNA_START=159 /DNA_END=2747 /DNA_ORIENTATION=-
MKFRIGELEVFFPYDYVYPEQYNYMRHLKQTLDGEKGHCLLEMPTGTGKTVSLLSLILSYQLQHSDCGKLVYCTRTVQEMDKVVEELRRVMKYISQKVKEDGMPRFHTGTISISDQRANKKRPRDSKQGNQLKKSKLAAEIESVLDNVSSQTVPKVPPLGSGIASSMSGLAMVGVDGMLGVCLSSRRNMCIHPDVSSFDNRNKVDALCRNRTAPFVRERNRKEQLCDFYENYSRMGSDASMQGIYSLHDMMQLGHERGWCPYFMARTMINRANVVVYNYQYMLDPKISGMVSREIERESIVVFDEAHNIDNVCIEALSVMLNRRIMRRCSANIRKLEDKLGQVERSDKKKLQDEYKALVEGLNLVNNDANSDMKGGMLLANPVLSQDILKEAMPGNIRRGKNFLNYLRALGDFIKLRMDDRQRFLELPGHFIEKLKEETKIIEPKAMRFCYSRLNSLLKTLEVTDMDEFTPIQLVANFCTLLATYNEGFRVLYEPHDERTPHIEDPKLKLCCVDASIAIKPVFERFRNVIITSGTLSPLDFYTRILQFSPKLSESLDMKLSRKCILPIIVTKGSDQAPISSKFEMRDNKNCLKNYGDLLVQLCEVVPDGIVCFFTSYEYMEMVVSHWGKDEVGILKKVLKEKLIFIETKDVVETSTALDAFKKACNCGRGAVFFSIARGKVSEGIDFNNHYGRCVVMFGIPYQYTKSNELKIRTEFLESHYNVPAREFITFDALRQTSQCVGRVIRSKTDYGIMIFADVRYAKADKLKKLPKWVIQYMDTSHRNLSTDRAVSVCRTFLRTMGQPRSQEDEIGVTMYNRDQIETMAKELGLDRKFAGGFQGSDVAEDAKVPQNSTPSSLASIK